MSTVGRNDSLLGSSTMKHVMGWQLTKRDKKASLRHFPGVTKRQAILSLGEKQML